MRRAIDTAPKDGKFVILEDDAGGFELARWSAEARGWVRENGELSKTTPTYWHRTRRDDYLLQEGDEFILQKEAGSSAPSASPTYLHPARRDDFLLQQGDEFILQKETGSSGASAPRESRSFRFPSGQAAPQRPVAADAAIALRQVAKLDPVDVVRLEARAAQDKSERGPPARRWFAVSSIAAAMVAASFTGLYFHDELAAYVTRYIGEQDNVRTGTAGVEAVKQATEVPSQDLQKADSLARDQALHQQANRASSQAPRDTAQVKQGAEATRPEAQQPLEKERRREETLANELVKAQQVIAMQVELAGKARDQAAQLSQAAESEMAELRQSLQKERERAEALAGELAKARRDMALPGKARDQAAQRNQAAEKATASLQQSLKTEHDRAEALTGELAKARRDLETQVALAGQAGDGAAQLKQFKEAAESATVELRQSLQTERNRAEALTGELARARRDLEAQVALSSKAGDEAAQVKKDAESAMAELRQSLQKEHDRTEAPTGELAKARRDLETQLALSSKAGDEAMQVKQAAESATAELRQSLQKEHERAEALTGELARVRRDTETQLALSSKAGQEAAQQKKAAESATAELQKEHDRAEALSSELARAQRDTETQVALSGKAGDEAAQVKKAAESATAELRLSLQKEHERAEALTSELARAQRDTETQVALSSKAGDEAVQVKKAAESATAELRQSLQKEHERAEALSIELARAQRDTETQVALSSKAGDGAAQLEQIKAAESATAELRQSLKTEHDRAEALASELATARTTVYAYEAQARKASDQTADLKQAAESAALELRKPLQQERERAARLEQDLAAARRDNEKQIALASKTGDEAAQLKQAAESAAAELRQSLQKEHDRAEALNGELARARRDLETQLALSSKAGDEVTQVKTAAESATAELRQSLQTERDKAEALTGELARARRDFETQLALSSKAGDEVTQVKTAAESATAELRQSLQKEHYKAEALTSELERAQRDIERQVALASKAGDEAAQLKQLKEAAESATAELRLSLQKERDRAAAGREPTQPTVGARIEVERASNSQTAQVKQAPQAAATEQPAVAEAQGRPEAARLLARASALISQGNIGAARIVLERAVETGSAQASFMLAETYDPLVLSTWKTYGTRGDVTKARELYAKALAGGIQEAKDRSVALH